MNIYLVDDDPFVRASLEATLRAHFEARSFANAEDFLEALDGLEPGVVLLDLAMPRMDGNALHRVLLKRQAPMAVIFLTGHGRISTAVEAMRRGAVDFLCKPVRRAELVVALKRAGERLATCIKERDRRLAVAGLSERERQVLQALASGASSKTIAYQLGISARTVEMHRARICEKLGASTTAAVALATEAGLIRTLAEAPVEV